MEIDDKKPSLSKAEIDELREIFCLVDLDGGGTISKDELATLMMNVGLEASKAELTNLVNEIDIHGTGEIDFDTFVACMSRKVSTTFKPTQIKSALKKFEKPSGPSGSILVRDLITVLTEFGDPSKRMTKEEAGSLISKIAPNLRMDDYFNYADYVDVLFSS